MNKLFLKILIVLSFCQGLLYYVGFETVIYKGIMVFLTMAVFLAFLESKKIKIKRDRVLILFLLYLVVVFYTSYINETGIKDIISYILYQLPALVIYIFVRMVRFSEKQIINLNKLFFFIFLFQIFVSVIKLLFKGTSETVIGTMHFSNGSLNTIVPLVGISMLISFYLFYEGKRKYLWLILGFLFMAWTGEKRAVWFYFVLLSFLGYYFHIIMNKGRNIFKSFRRIFYFLPIILAIFYFGVRYSPTLNPDNKMGGRFDIEYLYNYAFNYYTQADQEGSAMGRFSGLINVFQTVRESDGHVLLFGRGPAEILGITEHDDSVFSKYRVTSMITINGWSTTLICIGFAGAIITVLLYLHILLHSYKFVKFEHDKYWKAIGFGTLLISVVFFIDFFTYTRSFYHSIPLNITLFYFYAVLKNRSIIIKNQQKLFKE